MIREDVVFCEGSHCVIPSLFIHWGNSCIMVFVYRCFGDFSTLPSIWVYAICSLFPLSFNWLLFYFKYNFRFCLRVKDLPKVLSHISSASIALNQNVMSYGYLIGIRWLLPHLVNKKISLLSHPYIILRIVQSAKRYRWCIATFVCGYGLRSHGVKWPWDTSFTTAINYHNYHWSLK